MSDSLNSIISTSSYFERSGASLITHATTRMKAPEVVAEFEDKEKWQQAARVVYEIFSTHDNFLLTFQTFDWIKKKALIDLQNDPSLKSCRELTQMCQKVEKILDETFKKIQWHNALTPTNFGDFHKIYHLFMKNYAPKLLLDWIENEQWITEEGYSFDLATTYQKIYDFRNLEVSIPLAKIQEIFNKYSVIQLRPIDKTTTTLIIGCGNGRLCCGGGTTLPFFHQERDRARYYCNYSMRHLHPHTVTIDPTLSANATVIAFFGDQPVAEIFEGHKFEKIIFEGYYDDLPQKFRKRDLCQLLKEDGDLYIDYGNGPLPLETIRIKNIDREDNEPSALLSGLIQKRT